MEATQFSPTIDSAPASAYQFRVPGNVELGRRMQEVDDDTHPVSMTARTGDAIFHPFWGWIAHDLAGVQHHAKVPIDYCHETEDSIGFLDRFDPQASGLQVHGRLVPFREDDRASEVLYKAQRGVPYQASIDWGGEAEFEYLGEGQASEVNGYEFKGPGVIVRKWTLAAVAICPHGADSGTATTLSRGVASYPVRFCRTATSSKGDEMPDESTEVLDPVEVQEEVVEATPEVTPEADVRTELARFIAEFGAEGAEWFLANRTFDECRSDQLRRLRSEIDALKAANAALEARMSAAAAAAGGGSPLAVGAERVEGEKPKSFFKNVPGVK